MDNMFKRRPYQNHEIGNGISIGNGIGGGELKNDSIESQSSARSYNSNTNYNKIRVSYSQKHSRLSVRDHTKLNQHMQCQNPRVNQDDSFNIRGSENSVTLLFKQTNSKNTSPPMSVLHRSVNEKTNSVVGDNTSTAKLYHLLEEYKQRSKQKGKQDVSLKKKDNSKKNN